MIENAPKDPRYNPSLDAVCPHPSTISNIYIHMNMYIYICMYIYIYIYIFIYLYIFRERWREGEREREREPSERDQPACFRSLICSGACWNPTACGKKSRQFETTICPPPYAGWWFHAETRYRGTSLVRNTPLLGPYSRTILRVLRRS